MPVDQAFREQLLDRYLAALPYPPYPVQDEALLAWFGGEPGGVLVCAPTGTGKTLIAEAALFEALHAGTKAYYTTPLIALTEQKFHEIRKKAKDWGFSPDSVGLVTGNRKVNPAAPILVVVAEILLNRLLNPHEFPMEGVTSVVMDEFHNFADQERGIVWELSLAYLPPTARLMLLSATVGNSREFLNWLSRSHGRKLDLVESFDRKVPLSYHWIPDEFLPEHLEWMAKGEGESRKTPTLVFCFNRDQCWSVAEILKGHDLMAPGTRGPLLAELDKRDMRFGAGPRLLQLLKRGIGIHHAGLLPRYRRIVEELFEKKLLSVAVCTETLAAGINLPARSVVLTSLAKGPAGKQKLIDASTAQQIFGRAGRPQFDDKGHVFCLAHEEDVRLLRWKRQYDAIPEDTKDPALIRKRKELRRKKPERNDKFLHWTENQFNALQVAAPVRLYSKGPLPWRLLAHLLSLSPDVGRVRAVIRKRLLDSARVRAGEVLLERMLVSLHQAGYVRLDPPPPPEAETTAGSKVEYQAALAHPEPSLARLLAFRSVHPLLADWLCPRLAIADDLERLQILEGLLGMPVALVRSTRVPGPEHLPPGKLQTEILDPELLRRGLIAAPKPPGEEDDEDDDPRFRERPPCLVDRVRMLFEDIHPGVGELEFSGTWAAGEILERYSGNFEVYIRNRELLRQEGIIFRHLLRLVLLCGEFSRVPPETDPAGVEAWVGWLGKLAQRATEICLKIDPQSTQENALALQDAPIPVVGKQAIPGKEEQVSTTPPIPSKAHPGFGSGLGEEFD